MFWTPYLFCAVTYNVTGCVLYIQCSIPDKDFFITSSSGTHQIAILLGSNKGQNVYRIKLKFQMLLVPQIQINWILRAISQYISVAWYLYTGAEIYGHVYSPQQHDVIGYVGVSYFLAAPKPLILQTGEYINTSRIFRTISVVRRPYGSSENLLFCSCFIRERKRAIKFQAFIST